MKPTVPAAPNRPCALDERPSYLPNGSVGPEVRQLLDEMLALQSDFLPKFR